MTTLDRHDILMPSRIRKLARDHRGFPTPWFVQWFFEGQPCEYGHGEPDFRVADHNKFHRALNQKLCWVCGEPLGVHLAFVIGPMCAVNRITSEPPCHLECAEFSAKTCPFLTRPRMRRNEHELPVERVEPAGIGLKRNPGVACIWITRSYKPFRPGMGQDGILLHLGEPARVLWFAEGRPATRNEVMASIESGLPALDEVAKLQGADAVEDLNKGLKLLAPLLPTLNQMTRHQ